MKGILLGIAMALSVPAGAVPVYNLGNGNYYERFDVHLSWYDANSLAQSMSYLGVAGHLATVTSEAENTWIHKSLTC